MIHLRVNHCIKYEEKRVINMAKMKTKRKSVNIKAKKKSATLKGKKRAGEVVYEEEKRSEAPIIIFGIAFCVLLLVTLIAIVR